MYTALAMGLLMSFVYAGICCFEKQARTLLEDQPPVIIRKDEEE